MEINKLYTYFKDNTNLNYYKDIIRKVSDYDSNLKKYVKRIQIMGEKEYLT